MGSAIKHLLLVRHAQAVPQSGGGDAQRALTTRGVADARSLGARLLRQGWSPGHWAVSTAWRALQTADALCANESAWRRTLVVEPSLYLASVPALGGVLRQFPPVPEAAVVGHNPGLSEWFESLCGERVQMATAEALLLGFQVAAWDQVAPGSGRLVCRYESASQQPPRGV